MECKKRGFEGVEFTTEYWKDFMTLATCGSGGEVFPGDADVVYVNYSTATTPEFRRFLLAAALHGRVSHLVIDEIHSLFDASTYRREMLTMPELVASFLGQIPVERSPQLVLLSGTMPAVLEEWIRRRFGYTHTGPGGQTATFRSQARLRARHVVHRFEATSSRSALGSCLALLGQLLRSDFAGQKALIICLTVAEVEACAAFLETEFECPTFQLHSGLSLDARKASIEGIRKTQGLQFVVGTTQLSEGVNCCADFELLFLLRGFYSVLSFLQAAGRLARLPSSGEDTKPTVVTIFNDADFSRFVDRGGDQVDDIVLSATGLARENFDPRTLSSVRSVLTREGVRSFLTGGLCFRKFVADSFDGSEESKTCEGEFPDGMLCGNCEHLPVRAKRRRRTADDKHDSPAHAHADASRCTATERESVALHAVPTSENALLEEVAVFCARSSRRCFVCGRKSCHTVDVTKPACRVVQGWLVATGSVTANAASWCYICGDQAHLSSECRAWPAVMPSTGLCWLCLLRHTARDPLQSEHCRLAICALLLRIAVPGSVQYYFVAGFPELVSLSDASHSVQWRMEKLLRWCAAPVMDRRDNSSRLIHWACSPDVAQLVQSSS